MKALMLDKVRAHNKRQEQKTNDRRITKIKRTLSHPDSNPLPTNCQKRTKTISPGRTEASHLTHYPQQPSDAGSLSELDAVQPGDAVKTWTLVRETSVDVTLRMFCFCIVRALSCLLVSPGMASP